MSHRTRKRRLLLRSASTSTIGVGKVCHFTPLRQSTGGQEHRNRCSVQVPTTQYVPLPEPYTPRPNLPLHLRAARRRIHLRFEAKQPGTAATMKSVDIDFTMLTRLATPIPEAYEKLLLEARGDHSVHTCGQYQAGLAHYRSHYQRLGS